MEKKNSIEKKKDRGYTLLEYAAGAAVIGAVVFGVINILGGGFEGLATNIAGWARGVDMPDTTYNPGGTNPAP